MNKTVLIIGANRGLGFELAKLYYTLGDYVIGTYRTNIPQNLNIIWEHLDLRNKNEISNLLNKYMKIDILINNSAVYLDDYRRSSVTISTLPLIVLEETLNINYISAFISIQSVLSKMICNGYGRIINISSGMGRMDQLNQFAYAYKVSKLLLNTLTISFSDILSKSFADVAIVSICPGWMKTEMGTQNGVISPKDAAMEIVKIAARDKAEINGKFYRNGIELDFIKK